MSRHLAALALLAAWPAVAQAQQFLTVLKTQDVARRAPAKSGLYDYLRTGFAENRAWDRMFRELLLPDESDAKQKGAGEFLKSRVKDLNRLTIDVSTVFFGI